MYKRMHKEGLASPLVLHLGTTDNWFDCGWPLWGREERPAGDESACEVARSEPNRPKFKALESGNALGNGLTKGIRSIQGGAGRVAFSESYRRTRVGQ